MGSDDFDKMSSRGTELSTETGGMGSKQKTNNGRLNKMKTGGSVLEPEFRSSIIKGKNKDKATPIKEEPKMQRVRFALNSRNQYRIDDIITRMYRVDGQIIEQQ